ncbi:Lysine exporter protein (LYSE/YGGA) OS=Tsukamurella paurometabola (strain ATCC 8368 / DSM /CCUG 35730 / CIP 100753 / JCM 10117 / KCTC 9821 / NBRC 16120/ NCIMB 702349 / NCTC 13040) OX=521096 GN=Tpau_0614 PE=4 SV=1 [Tsukamurella paurometabola]|uniref:Lysine exporter protein (LYSE/YGGA) n=1 Tax=Tsukamurella paurometabola (strain ATCC 8368 / DSM 20162 / CCUG 35730 / CIP 100753 / JCM 10117 / KCTC 9821 / NBRC 16120 / NCIMB 702349 / NCTC 13040) TaxID=521096 RepID=D5USW5_TSUPD|nr:LysE family transporter [Tsukamurella paurometabola]ADG77252.1 Lysine exporter protein (LYSE/YGGA) [Tsukamurella paurometabola DSM 20162]SUP43289.1 Threonine efflux protein [Tsukamurella paurometabola]
MSSPLFAAAGFGLAVLPICLTPGVSFTLVTDRALTSGPRAAGSVILGTVLGLLTHALLAAAGLSAVVMASAEAFLVVKLLGAGYLVGLGLWMIRTSLRGAPASAPAVPWHRGGDVVRGYLGNVLNPKAAAVYLTLAPQFLDPGVPVAPQLLWLWMAHAVVAAGWLLVWGGVVTAIRRRVDLRRFRRRITGFGGVVMVGLGVRSAVAR